MPQGSVKFPAVFNNYTNERAIYDGTSGFIHAVVCCGVPTFLTRGVCILLHPKNSITPYESPIAPLVVHQPTSRSIWPAVPSHRWGMSIDPVVDKMALSLIIKYLAHNY